MYKIIIVIIIFFSYHSVSESESSENNYYLMLKNNKVYVRYGPNKSYPIKFIYKKKFFPVKVIDKKDNFRKIIDHKKNSGWIHRVMLKKSNSLIVLEDKILFKKNSKISKPLVKLKKGRLVHIKKCLPGWCKIKADKFIGWIETKNIWGKIN